MARACAVCSGVFFFFVTVEDLSKLLVTHGPAVWVQQLKILPIFIH